MGSSDSLRFPRSPRPDSVEHQGALARRDAAMDEEVHAQGAYEASVGTPHEFAASVALADVRDRLAARQAWVNWIERDY